jgi:hypothetical protein
MRRTILVVSLLLFPLVASAQPYGQAPPPPDDAQEVEAAGPPEGEPDAPPPAPPAQGAYAQQPAAAQGEWVFTAQYGWVWMPYGQQYVDDAYSPRQYVYSVRLGWSWVAAPWLAGNGVHLRFGHLGPAHFARYRANFRGGYAREGGAYHRTVPVVRGRSRR